MNNYFYLLGYKFVSTCFACPEQYDVFDPDGNQVAYLRLRHGSFRVDVPDSGGETIYTATPHGDGIFENSERLYYLIEAVNAIVKWKIDNMFKQLDY